jgi:hypothetical protein
MRRIKQRPMTSLGRRPWTAVVLCLLFAFGAILHVAHATPAQAHASAPQVIAVSDGADLCEPGHAAGEHCQPTNGCPLCAPIATAETFFDRARARLPMAAAAPVPGGVVTTHFHPPRPALHA